MTQLTLDIVFTSAQPICVSVPLYALLKVNPGIVEVIAGSRVANKTNSQFHYLYVF